MTHFPPPCGSVSKWHGPVCELLDRLAAPGVFRGRSLSPDAVRFPHHDPQPDVLWDRHPQPHPNHIPRSGPPTRDRFRTAQLLKTRKGRKLKKMKDRKALSCHRQEARGRFVSRCRIFRFSAQVFPVRGQQSFVLDSGQGRPVPTATRTATGSRSPTLSATSSLTPSRTGSRTGTLTATRSQPSHHP